MLWGLAWYWNAVILGLLIPWVTAYRDLRDSFDEGLKFGLGVSLGASAVSVSAVLAGTFLLGFVPWRSFLNML
jgi:hypothetical protein